MGIFKSVVFLLLFFCFLVQESNGAEYNCRTKLFSSEAFVTLKVHFFIHDKVFLQTVCHDLPAGEHEMGVVWHNPLGEVQRQDRHIFSLKTDSGYSAFFWIKVQKKGPLSATLSNESYSAKFYGGWNVKLYLDEVEIESQKFKIVQ